MLNLLSFSCPLLLAATGALFSEYTGCLALFMDGLITFCGFLTFAFTTVTGSVILGTILSAITASVLCLLFAFIIEKTHPPAHRRGPRRLQQADKSGGL